MSTIDCEDVMTLAADFESVYRDNYDRLYTLAFRMMGTRDEAEDVLQTAFVNAFAAYEGFRGESAVTTWLHRIVINTSKQRWKQRAKLPVTEWAEEKGTTEEAVYAYINRAGPTDDEVLTNQTREACLQMFMNCMPPRLRAVFTLRSILGFSVRDTAAILSTSEGAVKVDLHRARKAIRAHFEGRCSLIHPGAICDCRSYAGHLRETGREKALVEIETIRSEEQASAEQFAQEICEILDIERLYATRVRPLDWSSFRDRVAKLYAEHRLKTLGADSR